MAGLSQVGEFGKCIVIKLNVVASQSTPCLTVTGAEAGRLDVVGADDAGSRRQICRMRKHTTSTATQTTTVTATAAAEM